MEEVESTIPIAKKPSKKSNKHYHLALSTSKLRTSSSHSSRTLPPSFTKVQSPPSGKTSSRSQDRFSGLWEWYYNEEEGGETSEEAGVSEDSSLLKNIRGFLMKRRKSPLKGWHKRYFVLEKGILYFSRSYAQMVKGKVSGTLDLGYAFIHYDGSSRRIDVDGENHVLHLKTKNASHFAAWSSCLVSHEMYRKSQLASGKSDESGMDDGQAPMHHGGVSSVGVEEWVSKTHKTIAGIKKDMEIIHESLEAMSIYVRSPRNNGNLFPSTSGQSSSSDKISDVTSETSSTHSAGSDSTKGEGSGGVASKKKFMSRKGRKDKKKDANTSSNLSPDQGLSTSVYQTSDESVVALPNSVSDNAIIRDDFTAIAKLVYVQFCEVMERLDKMDSGLQSAVEETTLQRLKQEAIISNQLQLLRQTMAQNTELHDRLTQIQAIATGTEFKGHLSTPVGGPTRRTPNQSYRKGSSSIPRYDSFISLHSTLSEKFFDALDEVRELSSSEDEAENTEDEETGDESDNEMFSSLTHDVLTQNALSSLTNISPNSKPSVVLDTPITEEEEEEENQLDLSSHDTSPDPGLQREQKGVVRRRKLPAPIADTADFSLWSLLRKNIGKDLSKISMPVSMNEPLSALQRLCEELEYSELLDQAVTFQDPFDRMVRVACFAVSSYALSYHRAGRKPFNPLLGETYELIREDKGFKFIAEQVSHHPPIAACHCISPNFQFWQDARIKSKFWGKSMEVFPIGITNVTLPKFGDHYEWKKVTSCIHNVLGGQRWVDQYGEMTITNKDLCSCTLTFVKASYWSSKKYVVYGDVYNSDGAKVRHVFGAWNKAMFCGEENGDQVECIWRASDMPVDNEQYYGFSYFAIELNELLEGQEEELPCTDCRFRPDQRLLENGNVQEAETEKRRVEQIQREARAERERLGEEWSPHFFTKVEDESGGQEKWITNNTYWTKREERFKDLSLPVLW